MFVAKEETVHSTHVSLVSLVHSVVSQLQQRVTQHPPVLYKMEMVSICSCP